MKKTFSAIFFAVLLAALFTQVRPALAENCPTGQTYSPTTAVCNPTPNFFLDLGPTNNTFAGIALYIIQKIIQVAGILALAFIIIGGFQYITARGNEEQAESSKKTLTNAIIGLVIVILSQVIIAVVVNAVFGHVG